MTEHLSTTPTLRSDTTDRPNIHLSRTHAQKLPITVTPPVPTSLIRIDTTIYPLIHNPNLPTTTSHSPNTYVLTTISLRSKQIAYLSSKHLINLPIFLPQPIYRTSIHHPIRILNISVATQCVTQNEHWYHDRVHSAYNSR